MFALCETPNFDKKKGVFIGLPHDTSLSKFQRNLILNDNLFWKQPKRQKIVQVNKIMCTQKQENDSVPYLADPKEPENIAVKILEFN